MSPSTKNYPIPAYAFPPIGDIILKETNITIHKSNRWLYAKWSSESDAQVRSKTWAGLFKALGEILRDQYENN